MCVGSWQDIVVTNCGIISIIIGRYYLAAAGYMESQGYMTPFRNTRYHMNNFRGVELEMLEREEKFNYIHSRLRNVIKRRFGDLKERWHILQWVPYFTRQKQADYHIMLCNG